MVLLLGVSPALVSWQIGFTGVRVGEASHPGPTSLTTEGVSSVPWPLNQDPRSGALSPSTPPASQVLVPPVAQAPFPTLVFPVPFLLSLPVAFRAPRLLIDVAAALP